MACCVGFLRSLAAKRADALRLALCTGVWWLPLGCEAACPCCAAAGTPHLWEPDERAPGSNASGSWETAQGTFAGLPERWDAAKTFVVRDERLGCAFRLLEHEAAYALDYADAERFVGATIRRDAEETPFLLRACTYVHPAQALLSVNASGATVSVGSQAIGGAERPHRWAVVALLRARPARVLVNCTTAD